MSETRDVPRVTRVNDGLLDRLVDGELDPRGRRELLAALDREPGGWRRCAMAFLEAQAWAGAVSAAEDCQRPAPAPAGARPGHMRLPWLGGLAAAVMVAFVAGFVARGPSRPRQAGPTYAAEPARPPARPGGTEAVALRPASVLPPYVRRQLEREGYEVDGEQKLVPVALADGRQVAVPVEALKYRFVGSRVH